MIPHFDGAEVVPERDNERLSHQIDRIFELMKDGRERTLADIAAQTGAPEASVSAQLRNLRKRRFGLHQVLRRYCGNGLFAYTVIANKEAKR